MCVHMYIHTAIYTYVCMHFFLAVGLLTDIVQWNLPSCAMLLFIPPPEHLLPRINHHIISYQQLKQLNKEDIYYHEVHPEDMPSFFSAAWLHFHKTFHIY